MHSHQPSQWGNFPRANPIETWNGLADMNNITGLAIFAVGIVLLIFGFNASQPFSGELARSISANSDATSIWLVAGGAAAVLAGLILAIRSRRV
jgi:hypothetical protein